MPKDNTVVDMPLTDPQADTSVAATNGSEVITRQARMSVLVQETRGLLLNVAQGHLAIGERLAELRSLASHGEWLPALEAMGVSPNYAKAHIKVFETVKAMPKLGKVANENYTKTLTLIEGMTEEQLEDTLDGQGDITIDDIDTLSVPQLRKRLKKLESKLDDVVAEETKALEEERDQLIEERDALTRRMAAHDGDALAGYGEVEACAEEVLKRVQALVKSCSGMEHALANARANAQANPDQAMPRALITKAESDLQLATRTLEDLWTDWIDSGLGAEG